MYLISKPDKRQCAFTCHVFTIYYCSILQRVENEGYFDSKYIVQFVHKMSCCFQHFLSPFLSNRAPKCLFSLINSRTWSRENFLLTWTNIGRRFDQSQSGSINRYPLGKKHLFRQRCSSSFTKIQEIYFASMLTFK